MANVNMCKDLDVQTFSLIPFISSLDAKRPSVNSGSFGWLKPSTLVNGGSEVHETHYESTYTVAVVVVMTVYILIAAMYARAAYSEC